jgi:rsbT antagonist protein RsbS
MGNTEANSMSGLVDVPSVAIQVSRDIVVASIQVELDDLVLARFREDLLSRIDKTASRGVIFDLSGLETIDSHEFAGLRSIITMSTIMGAESVLAGMRPGVVSALIEMGADVEGLRSAIDLDAAYILLSPEPEPAPELEPESDVESLRLPEAEASAQNDLPLASGQVPGTDL